MAQALSEVERRASLSIATSLVAMVALVLLIHRALPAEMTDAGSIAKRLFIGVTGFDALDRTFLLGVAGACAWAVSKRRPDTLMSIQLAALSAALLLTQYRLGTVPKKMDPRLMLGIFSGVVALQSCYLCLLAHAALWLRARFEKVGRGGGI